MFSEKKYNSFSQKKYLFFSQKRKYFFSEKNNIYIFLSPSIKGLCVGDRQNCVLQVDRDFTMRARAFN